MTKFIYIALLTLLGFFLKPAVTRACDKPEYNTEHCCSKGDTLDSERKNCCSENDKNDCEGQCGNQACNSSTNSSNLVFSSFYTQFLQKKIVELKPRFHYLEVYYSAGFLSIWLPPKISWSLL